MSVTASTKKPDSSKRAYRRQDPERRRAERKWFDPAMKRENHARRPGQGHGLAEER